MKTTRGEYTTVQMNLGEAMENTDEETSVEAMHEAWKLIEKLWNEKEKQRRLLQSAGETLVDISVLLEKHKKVVKKENS